MHTREAGDLQPLLLSRSFVAVSSQAGGEGAPSLVDRACFSEMARDLFEQPALQSARASTATHASLHPGLRYAHA